MDEKELTPEIIDALRAMDLFHGKDADELTEWLGKSTFEGGAESVLRRFPAGAVIIEEGSFGNCFFLLTSGSVSVSKGPERRELARFGPSSFFGEMALVSGLPRSATITALEPCVAIEVPRRAFEAWMKKPGPFRNTIDRAYLERGLANHLQMIPDFAAVDAQVLQNIAKKLRLRIFSKDEPIVVEGDPADSMYIIRDGYVRVVKKMAGGEQRTVAYLNDGNYFGENALLDSGPRQATVIAMGKVEAIQVMKDDFFTLINRSEKMLDRMRENQSKQRQAPSASESSELGFIGEILGGKERGFIKATSALVIHLNACTRCGNCVKACSELHDGISRLTRHGMLFEAPGAKPQNPLERLLVATSCMHCLDPECMIGCPTGAITRDINGEVVITDACIGCGNCARRCPYGNISMAETKAETELEKQKTGAPSIGGYFKFFRNTEKPEVGPANPELKAEVRRIAVKCDLCQEYNHNHGCVYNCPYSAIERIDPHDYLTQLQRGAM
jgi:CRP-like cAMP-binding protein/Fe-S-cluster-containing hydrogenase component 2